MFDHTFQISGRTYNTAHAIQIASEATVAFLYLISIYPGALYLLIFLIIPLLALNLVIGIKNKNETDTPTIINLVMSVVGLVPILGWFAILAGIALGIYNIITLSTIVDVTDTPKTVTTKSKTKAASQDTVTVEATPKKKVTSVKAAAKKTTTAATTAAKKSTSTAKKAASKTAKKATSTAKTATASVNKTTAKASTSAKKAASKKSTTKKTTNK